MTLSKRLFLGIGTGLAATLSVLVLMFIVIPGTAHAGGAVGGGGSGGGGSGGAQTGYGYGWYQYSLGSGGPGGFKNGNRWGGEGGVADTCQKAGTDSVIAFIVQTSKRSTSTAVVYTYTSAYGTYNKYLGNSGGGWLTYDTALARFNSIDPSIRAGYVWRSNVAWFCYSNFNYDLNPTISGTPDSTEAAADVTLNQVNINNTGSTNSAPASWRVTYFRMDPGDNNIPVAGTGTAAPTVYYGHKDVQDVAVKVGSAAPTTTPSQVFGRNSTSLASYVPVQQIPDAPVGTRFCYALSVYPRRHDAAQWRYSAPFCVIVTKQPKINVIGSDVLVGRGFSDTASQSSIIKTSVTTQKNQYETVPATPDKFTGLWRTGVSDTGNPATATKLGENKSDPHWIIANVIAPSGLNHCQAGYNLAGSFTTITSAGAQARTIREVGNMAGQATYPNSIVGDEVPTGVTDNAGGGVWSRVSSKARWISQNLYGQNYSLKACHDPTYPPNENNINRMNTYVFKLKDGFTIADDVDLNSVKLTISGGADNGVHFVINGHDANAGYAYPGWSAGSSVSTTVTQWLQHGPNTLSVYIKSNYSHTGLLIDEFTASGTVTRATSNQYGSWAEYGVSATGKVTGLASAAAYAGGVASTAVGVECAKAILTIANSTNKSACPANNPTLGNFDIKRTIPDIASRFPTGSNSLAGNVNLRAMNAQGVYKAGTGNVINLQTSELAPGQWVVINAPGATVNIDGNQTYANNLASGDPYTGTDQIPQLVIIASRINIRSGVGKVDAWLIASKGEGVINTCLDGTAADNTPLSADICNSLLEVNGPVQAKHLYLRRTFGAGTGATAGDPAEKFNLRSDAYLWAVTQASTTGRVQTVYTKELPPRF